MPVVLVAGHDLKFINPYMDYLISHGHQVLIDHWTEHNKHDESRSRELLQAADIIVCEWTLGNAVWYSRNKLNHQRLVTRFHSQELFLPYAKDVNYHNVDEVIFVGRYIAELAIRDCGVPRDKAVVIPNGVTVLSGGHNKDEESRFNVGLVGIIPAQKHLDRALDILVNLRKVDRRYRLFVKGKLPADYPWMANRPAEMEFFSQQFARIETDPLLSGAVSFDPHGNDMDDWYRKIGFVLSVSDFESFHLTLADGSAAGAVPASLAWPGSDLIYPGSWISVDSDGISERILRIGTDGETWRREGLAAKDYVRSSFENADVLESLRTVTISDSHYRVDSTWRKFL